MRARYTEVQGGDRTFEVEITTVAPCLNGERRAAVEIIERADGVVLIKVRPHRSARVFVAPLSDAAECIISRTIKADLAAMGRPVPGARRGR